ncbi:hypothetical protein [Lentilactobacillus hilgardii]|uniref:hypothetical protein n=1 Tax=Lentilactobacillus hilgardii TaxID=1588 RepID=UPI003FA58E89
MKRLVWLVSLSLVICLTLFMGFSVSASSYSHNPPKALRYSWETKTTKLKNRDFHHYYEYQSLFVTPGGKNARFNLEGFVLNRNKQSNNNTGPYGVFSSNKWIMAYQRASAHHYYVGGAMQPFGVGSHTPVEAGVVFSKNYKSIKVYLFKAWTKNGYGYRGKRSYVGHFYRGHHLYFQ